jgi:uncharacterized membrane protein HdeD (DUF308 family)
MLHSLARQWWVLLLNGVSAVLFGILAVCWPGLTLLALLWLFGIFCLVDGASAIGVSFARGDRGMFWPMLLLGVVSIIAGLCALAWPGLTALALVTLIGAWSIVRGLFEIIAAIELRKVIDNELLLGLAGVVSILFGIVLFARPGEGALALVWVIGVFAIARGALLVMLALRFRSIGASHPSARPAAAGS